MLQQLTKTLLDYPHRISVPFPHEDRIAQVLAGLKLFLAEPQEYKDSWTLGKDIEGQNEYGYYHREQNGRDRKEVIHYRKNLIAGLLTIGVDISPHRKFLNACNALYDASLAANREHLIAFARRFSEVSGDGGAFERKYLELAQRADELCLPTLRIMQYDEGGPVGKIVAARHADQGYSSLHVYASEDGLEFGWNHVTMDDFVPVRIAPGTAQLFPGRKMSYLTNWKVPALLHHVRATTNQQRQTIVLFDHTDSPTVPRWYEHIPN